MDTVNYRNSLNIIIKEITRPLLISAIATTGHLAVVSKVKVIYETYYPSATEFVKQDNR